MHHCLIGNSVNIRSAVARHHYGYQLGSWLGHCRCGISHAVRFWFFDSDSKTPFGRLRLFGKLGYSTDIPKGIETFGAVYVDAPGELDLEYVQA